MPPEPGGPAAKRARYFFEEIITKKFFQKKFFSKNVFSKNAF